MNNEEAKFILQGYRPNGADAGDVTFGPAVLQAKNDPLLGEWFARQQAFDGAISAKLGQVVAPADLRAAILAGGKVTAAGSPRRAWWNHPGWMGLAAGVALMITAGLALWPKQALALDDYAVADSRLAATHGHGGHGDATDAFQGMLSQTSVRLGQALPLDFKALMDSGCRHISYRGRDLLEVCFKRNGEWFHCYVGRARDFPRIAPDLGPALIDKGGAAIASWADDEHVFVVVSMAGRRSLQGLL